MRRTSGIRGACLALVALCIVSANAWQYDPDLMANPNMGLQPPMLPNFGMDPLGMFPQPMQMTPPPQMSMMPDPTMDFDPELAPLEPNGAPRFMQQPAVTSVVVRRNRMGQFSAVPGEEDVPAGEPCRAGEPGCGTAQVIETATTTTATPIDEDKDKERREEEERERRERKEKEDKRKREREEEEEKKKKEKEERDEKRKKEREEREEREKKEREEREERHRKEKEERDERQRERREKRREEDEQDQKDGRDEDEDDKPRRKHKSKKDDDEDDDKDKKKKKCSKCSKCQKKKDSKEGEKDEASLEGPNGKTIHVVVSTKGDDKDEDKEKSECDKKCDEESSCDKEEEEANKEDPLVAEKKKEYAKLTAAIKKDEEEFTKEADWLTKALSLIGELKQKTHNVQMHLNDMHKDMSLMERKRQRAAAELEEAEKKKGEESTLHKLEKELDLLMAASTSANEKINMFASRKAQYLAKIGEVRNMLQQIKLSHMMTNPSAFQSMAESFRAPPPPPEIGQPNGGQEDDKMEVIPQFR